LIYIDAITYLAYQTWTSGHINKKKKKKEEEAIAYINFIYVRKV